MRYRLRTLLIVLAASMVGVWLLIFAAVAVIVWSTAYPPQVRVVEIR